MKNNRQWYGKIPEQLGHIVSAPSEIQKERAAGMMDIGWATCDDFQLPQGGLGLTTVPGVKDASISCQIGPYVAIR